MTKEILIEALKTASDCLIAAIEDEEKPEEVQDMFEEYVADCQDVIDNYP